MISRQPHIGEGFVGDGVNAAHVNVVYGLRGGPVGAAWTTALATPRDGHVPFVAVAQPGVPILPFTLFVNKAAIESDLHGSLTWGAAQAGIAAGVGRAHEMSLFGRGASRLVLIAAVWVNPNANNEESVFSNNRDATVLALQMARAGGPNRAAALEAMMSPSNPYFRI
jgi:5,6,7,8-tetrahydromethanopterin hydro-lyase